MPAWTKESLSAPWPRKHDVQLALPNVYDDAVKRDGSDSLARHRPLGVVDQCGERDRRAGTSGFHESENIDALHHIHNCAKHVPGDWRERLQSSDHVVSVRDVKQASPE